MMHDKFSQCPPLQKLNNNHRNIAKSRLCDSFVVIWYMKIYYFTLFLLFFYYFRHSSPNFQLCYLASDSVCNIVQCMCTILFILAKEFFLPFQQQTCLECSSTGLLTFFISSAFLISSSHKRWDIFLNRSSTIYQRHCWWWLWICCRIYKQPVALQNSNVLEILCINIIIQQYCFHIWLTEEEKNTQNQPNK